MLNVNGGGVGCNGDVSGVVSGEISDVALVDAFSAEPVAITWPLVFGLTVISFLV